MLEPKQIKKFQCSDGAIYDTRDAAVAHEKQIQDPLYALTKKVEEMQMEIIKLQNRIDLLEHPFGRTNQPYANKQNERVTNPFIRTWYGTGETLDAAIDNIKEIL